MTVTVSGSGSDRVVTVTDERETRQVDERLAYHHARAEQGYAGSYEEWLEITADEREAYELGAAGVGN